MHTHHVILKYILKASGHTYAYIAKRNRGRFTILNQQQQCAPEVVLDNFVDTVKYTQKFTHRRYET